MRDIIVIAIVVLGALVSLRRPVIGILFFAFLGFFSPQSYTWSFGRTFPMSMLVAVTTILGTVATRAPKKIPAQREMALLILLWLTFVLSTQLAIFPVRAFPELVDISKIFLMIVLTTVLINDKEGLHWLIKVVAYSLGFYALKGGIFAIATGGNATVYGPELSFLNANNSIGLALAINIPLLNYLARKETNYWLRRLLQAMMLFSLPAILFTYSRGAWLGMGIAVALLVLRARQKVLIVTTCGFIAAIVLALVPNIAPNRLVNRYDQLVNYEEDDSAESRLWNWEFCRRVGMGRLTGGGFNFEAKSVYAQYYPEFQDRWPDKTWTCHSVWFTMLGDHGMLGVTLWIALVISCLASLRRLRLIGQGVPGGSWLVDFSNALQASVLAFLIVGTFLDAAYFDLFYYLVALIVIAKGIADAMLVKAPERSAVGVALASGARTRPVAAN